MTMGKTKGLYQEEFPAGTLVQIVDRETLENFRKIWGYHNPLQLEQIEYGGRTAEVESVGFYHGGDELYRLRGISGIWHEACLLPAQAK
jgi:hypothetical protein